MLPLAIGAPFSSIYATPARGAGVSLAKPPMPPKPDATGERIAPDAFYARLAAKHKRAVRIQRRTSAEQFARLAFD